MKQEDQGMNAIDQSFFDVIYDRRNTGAIKYDIHPETSYCGEVIPMWIADMDFKSPPAVDSELLAQIRHGIFGYTEAGEDYDRAVAAWYQTQFGWNVRTEWLIRVPGVMFAVAAALRALTSPGDSVLICQPVYFPFANVIQANNRNLVVSELILHGGRYEIDFTDLEEKIRTNAVKVFLFCSPHNPVGRVWTREELTEIGRICRRHDVAVISDEIHSDFVFSDHPHIPIASLDEELARRTVTCTAPSKTFNLAGLQAGNIIIPDAALRRRVRRECLATGYGQPNTLAIAATKAAYLHGKPWLDALLDYLRQNYSLLAHAFPPGGRISLIPPEGTYLAWLDCRRLGLSDSALQAFFLNQAGVQPHFGAAFGAGGSGFVRLNIACPRSVLAQAIDRICQAVRELSAPDADSFFCGQGGKK